MEELAGFEPAITVLQTDSLTTLGYNSTRKKWLGRLDSNQSMQESKSCALPAWLHPNVKRPAEMDKPFCYIIVTTCLANKYKNTSAKRCSETHVPFTLSSLAFRKSQNLVRSGVLSSRSDTAFGCVLPFSIPLFLTVV